MRLILSISSDIGTALAEDWISTGIKVAGTYRTWSNNCENLKSLGVELIHCDFADKNSIETALLASDLIANWEVMVLAAGDQNPIGLFKDVKFDEWESSIKANFSGMLRFLHRSIGFKSNYDARTVIFLQEVLRIRQRKDTQLIIFQKLHQ